MTHGAFRLEAWRKAVHLATIVLPAWVYWAPWPWTWRGPLLAFLGVLAVDVVRLTRPQVGRLFDARVGAYLRDHEAQGLVSVHALTGTATLLALAAPPGIAATALLYLVVGDAAAALVGRRFGRTRFGRRGRKSLEGSLACLLVCLAAGAALLPGHRLAVAGGALAATLAEALPWPVDDNWSVPLVGAAVLVLLV